ncbi:MAG: transcription termination/antitermination protein NusG [Chloroflexus sp.]|jgi:transcriptional antiterminator NusG|uniref:transcription termination/antitermination protein NusG n=1 Tax=unclassified Chloroflexus TaxID=2633855 RepID=UPI00048B876C|nr:MULTISPECIES: transcription termination/antitermination protein NusG [unclassified Chloroflexus]MBO9314841.1 transcription termination/antitermination protein NusG [Chloroflexus sp.]MDN5273382.1 transcription termination/antitermination protein NusG [Chloroflexus sp. MS-CIW-1]
MSEEKEKEKEKEADDRRWYVIHTYSGYENKVKKNLEHRIASMEMQDQIFRVIVPTEEEIEIKNGQRRTVNKKIYPGYVLVQMRLTDDSWYVVRNTPGVTSFVGHGNKPTPLDEEEVKAILRQMEGETPKVRVSYQKGQAVKIIDGPFTDFEGIVDAIDHERGRVRVLVSFFGREAPVELDFLQVTRLVE